jgi:7,8-dihydropterin-6-yl-methyl-4-(beta-D-ribofuranosyl)aminobenzene 5'-phosphate synthase
MTMDSIDTLEVVVIVDNATDGLSTTQSGVVSEFAGLAMRGLRPASSRCLCCAVHGLSLSITATRPGVTKTVLFDTGPEDAAFERNVTRLGIDLARVDEIVLSHGHWDHCGAVLSALNRIRSLSGRSTTPVHIHPDMFAHRGVRFPSDVITEMDDIPGEAELLSHGAELRSSTNPSSLDVGLHLSGEIPRVSSFENGMPGQMRRIDTGWVADEEVRDERWLGANVNGLGLVVFTACSHAGLINVLTDASNTFPDTPIHAVIGGFHLAGSNEKHIPATVEALAPFDLQLIGPGHCTGWRAVNALTARYGDTTIQPLAVGTRLTFGR